MSAIDFIKMHGCGNDFVVLDERRHALDLDEARIRRIADRRRGVGFDQLVLLRPSSRADAAIAFYNSDGTLAGACGNGTRCAVRLLMDETGKDELVLETRAGLVPAWREKDGLIAVLMPEPKLGWQDVPLARACDTLRVPLDDVDLPAPVALSMGNPQVVFFVPDLEALDVPRLGARLERHPMFPDRANVGFAQMLGPDLIRLRVFERGAGLTLACGSGACAALVAAIRRGLVQEEARLVLDGGELRCRWEGKGPVTMIGPTALGFRGRLTDELLEG